VTARVDKWLWAVRLFKTRGMAVEAIRAGAVAINDHPVKPAREVRAGEIVTVQQGLIRRTLRVVGAPPSRVGAKLVAGYCTDLTPPEEFEKLRVSKLERVLARPKGSGRPTKRDRREVDRLFG
jgi:ribosome-associated heat shock protein Hsp15